MTESQKAQMAKVWLNRNYGLSRQLRSLKKRRESQVFGSIGRYEDGFSGSAGNSEEDRMISYAELNAKIEEIENRLREGDELTKEVIDQVENPLFWSLLRDRYLDRKGWRVIAKSYGYSEQHIYHLHGRALLEIFPYIPEKEVEIHD